MPSGSLIAMPTFPAAPMSIEPAYADTIGQTVSTFNPRSRQMYNWGVGPDEISIAMPNMSEANFAAWLTFLRSLKGPVNYFQTMATFTAAYPEYAGKYWRLKQNRRNWVLQTNRFNLLTLDCIEAF